MNTITITGNITKDIELRYIPQTETAVANVTVAVKRPHTKDKTDFIMVAIFGKTAENCERFLHKGSKVLVQGALMVEDYEKDGQKRKISKINAETVEFLDSKPKEGEEKPNNEHEGFAALEDDSDFIPF